MEKWEKRYEGWRMQVLSKIDVISRMREDLKRALEKPVEERHWVMVIDVGKCIGCDACTVACKAENKTPPGVVYNIVLKEEIGTYPNVTRRFVPRPCMQCEKPPCVKVCPATATYKRPDGVVVVDYEHCVGCRYCLSACPYGARYFDKGDFYTRGTPEIQPYETAPNFEYEREWEREPGSEESPVGNARKCTFCLHRVEKGMLPACIVTCLGRARYFGDLDDGESLVSKLVSEGNVMRLKEDLGTEPSVYYLL